MDGTINFQPTSYGFQSHFAYPSPATYIHSTMERTWFFLVWYCCLVGSLITMAAQTEINHMTTDQHALLALKSRITSDPQNMISTNWSTTTPVCNWVGVTCGAHHFRVEILNLSYLGLSGTMLPPELGNLSFLVSLDFTNNSFYGNLPAELAHLRGLKFISLEGNNFKGIIPSCFGSLYKLQRITLRGNKFSGSIPTAMFNLTTLEIINLNYNQLSGTSTITYR
jgi:LRR receptor-like serine/threonine-protein kinase FLS2